ncbi:hypothetical protein SAY87_028032 [Trapa incisa]|uniref:Protein kinase domain-containing protein n=1 Tax=Trapa incisa TaxID=236973 RepID=A0AAN7QR90_9MYRT|nr:hypothetical protein SAY87_028032 [Trapa incisa]
MEMEWIRGEEIGRGGFSRISLAVPKEKYLGLPPLMAVKSSHLSKSAILRNELQILRRLGESPHVIRCFGSDVSVEGGSELYNLLLEYAPGGSLVSEMKKRGGKLPETDVRRHARSVVQALCHIHRRGFVHGDIKVQNILVFPSVDGCGAAAEVKVADFGLAREAGSLTRSTPENDGGGGEESRASVLPSPVTLPWEFQRKQSEFNFRPFEEPDNRASTIGRIQRLSHNYEIPSWEYSDGSLWFDVR